MVFYFKGCKQIFFCFIKSNEYLIHMTEVSRYGLCGLGHQCHQLKLIVGMD
jgi:hypothetical protein